MTITSFRLTKSMTGGRAGVVTGALLALASPRDQYPARAPDQGCWVEQAGSETRAGHVRADLAVSVADLRT